MMIWKLVFFFALICVDKYVLADFECYYCDIRYNLNCKFYCTENSNEHDVLLFQGNQETDEIYVNSYGSVSKSKFLSIDFENCPFNKIENNSMGKFENLETLIMSNSELKKIPINFFGGVNSLLNLNLAHNNLSELGPHLFPLASLVTLDLSHNNLTNLNEHAFDELINLKHLNLSHNPIGDLEIGTFAYLSNLEVLSLKHTNISSIQLGTFSHQHKLIALDLSENNLKLLDFELFLPILHDLQSLYLNQNQLTDLHGFRNAIFPQLALLDIKNNQFNCSYLRSFIASVDWKNLHMPVDPHLTKVNEPNIRGVNCRNLSTPETPHSRSNIDTELDENSNVDSPVKYITQLSHPIEITSKSFEQLHEDINFLKIVMVSLGLCMIFFIFYVIFLTQNQLSSILRRPNMGTRQNTFSDPIVEYMNEELLLN